MSFLDGQNVRRVLSLTLALAGAGCGAEMRGPEEGGIGNGQDMAMGGGPTPDLMFDNDAFWAQDPPPKYCALDGGPPPMVPGGTPDCPDDKNREGCPCPTEGMMAPCWPGLRVNRNLGDCHDGMTTCVAAGELSLAWGPCMGYVLPVPGATDGKAACKCFSGGRWALDDLTPCIFSTQGGTLGDVGATSATEDMTKMVSCMAQMAQPLVQPAGPWSQDTVTADCEGHFKLCYTLKAGDPMNPSPNDCVLGQACVESDYIQANQAQSFPPLPPWVSNDVACAEKFAASGYGEMSVDGVSLLCDPVQKVFNRVTYCPLSCATNPTDPKCTNCMQGGGGNF
jgi:hypothetical protein